MVKIFSRIKLPHPLPRSRTPSPPAPSLKKSVLPTVSREKISLWWEKFPSGGKFEKSQCCRRWVGKKFPSVGKISLWRYIWKRQCCHLVVGKVNFSFRRQISNGQCCQMWVVDKCNFPPAPNLKIGQCCQLWAVKNVPKVANCELWKFSPSSMYVCVCVCVCVCVWACVCVRVCVCVCGCDVRVFRFGTCSPMSRQTWIRKRMR